MHGGSLKFLVCIRDVPDNNYSVEFLEFLQSIQAKVVFYSNSELTTVASLQIIFDSLSSYGPATER